MRDKYTIEVLPNNLRVLHLPYPTSGFVLVSLIGRVGRRAEKEDEVGCAHFLEHLFFDGSKKRPTAFDIASFIEDKGGFSNGSTSSEIVEYWAKIVADKSETAFDYLSDIFFNSILREEDINKERKVIMQESASKRDNPDAIMFRNTLSTILPDQPIGRTIFDEDINLENINKLVLTNYMNRNYISDNFVLAIAGNIDKEKAMSLASKYFKDFKAGAKVQFDKPHLEEEKVINIINKDIAQAKFSVSFRGYSMNSYESIVARIIAEIIGGGLSSRLSQKLRHQLHLVYGVSASHIEYSDIGYFVIETSASEDNIQIAIDEIFYEINKLMKDGVSDLEIEKAKNLLLADLFNSTEKMGDYMDFFSEQILLSDNVISINEMKKIINKVNKEDILSVAKHVFTDKPKVNLVTKNLDKLDINNQG